MSNPSAVAQPNNPAANQPRPRLYTSPIGQSLDALNVRLDSVFTQASHVLHDETAVGRLVDSIESFSSASDAIIQYLIELDTYLSLEHQQPHQSSIPIVLSSTLPSYQTHHAVLMKQQYDRIEQIRAKYRLVCQVSQPFFDQSSDPIDSQSNNQILHPPASQPISQPNGQLSTHQSTSESINQTTIQSSPSPIMPGQSPLNDPENDNIVQPQQPDQTIEQTVNHSADLEIPQPAQRTDSDQSTSLRSINSPSNDILRMTPSPFPDGDIQMETIE